MIIITSTGEVVETDPDPGPRTIGNDREVGTLRYVWTGWDGTSWDLTDWGGPVIKLRGAQGFGMAEETHWYTESPAFDGSTWNGSRTNRGSLFLPLELRGVDTPDYFKQRSAFLRSLDPKKTGTLSVITPLGNVRTSECRYASGLDEVIDVDPAGQGRERMPIVWDRADPHWYGEEVAPPAFTSSATLPFFAPAGQTPPAVVNISSSRQIGSAQVTNPGDLESWPIWRISGPFTSFTVGVGSSTVSMSLIKPDGWIDIDMNPNKMTVKSDQGNDWWSALTDVVFAPIPPGENIPLVTSVAGPGAATAVSLRFPTRYRTAW